MEWVEVVELREVEPLTFSLRTRSADGLISRKNPINNGKKAYFKL